MHKAKDKVQTEDQSHEAARIRCWPFFISNRNICRMSSDKEIWKARSLLIAWGKSLKQSSGVGHWYCSLLIQKCVHFPISPIISPIFDTNLDKTSTFPSNWATTLSQPQTFHYLDIPLYIQNLFPASESKIREGNPVKYNLTQEIQTRYIKEMMVWCKI